MNILFINNFQKADQICLLHTWFLSASMQFHVMGALILFIMYKYVHVLCQKARVVWQ